MIQKYLNENILLIPNVIYREKDNYIFNWTVDKKIKLSGHTAIYSFDKPGNHKVELNVTDIRTLASSVYDNLVNVITAEQKLAYDMGFGLEDFGNDPFGV